MQRLAEDRQRILVVAAEAALRQCNHARPGPNLAPVDFGQLQFGAGQLRHGVAELFGSQTPQDAVRIVFSSFALVMFVRQLH